MITLEMMPPMMFGGLVLAMLIGFPVAFTLAAVGLSFGFLAIHLGFFDLNFLQAIPGRVFGSVLSNELLLAIRWASCSGRSAAASAIRSSWSASSSAPSPARWRHRSSPWR
jgi:TRAP-type mannitol/chloroaromatic compound transport system permease large subunit